MWLTLLMALLSFFASKKSSNPSTSRALLTAGLVGAGTYYATTQTEVGRDSLAWLNDSLGITSSTVTAGTGNVPSDPTGSTSVPTASVSTPGFWSSVNDTLKSWGPTGTALVAGVAGSAITGNSKWLIYGGLAFAAFMLLK